MWRAPPARRSPRSAIYVLMAVVLLLQAAGPVSGARLMTATPAAIALALLRRVVALALPSLLRAAATVFYVSLASRDRSIYAIAATSLNLVLGYGGMVSFGHAAFVGTGAYAAGILVSEGVAERAGSAGPPTLAAAGARRAR